MNRLIIALAIVSTGILPAQTRAGTWKDGPAVTYVFGGDVESAGFGLGYQAAHEFNRHCSIEFSGLWHQDESDALAQSLPTGSSTPTVGLDVYSLALTGRVSFEPRPSVLTYAGAGVGYYILKADNEDVRNSLAETGFGFAEVSGDKEFGSHLVLGCEILITNRWEIFAEYRHTFLNSGYTTTYSPNRDSPEDSQRNSFDYNHSVVRVGINYRI